MAGMLLVVYSMTLTRRLQMHDHQVGLRTGNLEVVVTYCFWRKSEIFLSAKPEVE